MTSKQILWFCLSWATLQTSVYATEAFFAPVTFCETILGRRQFLNRSFKIENNQVKVAFFDADSTLRVSLSGAVTANSPEDVQLIPGVAEKIRSLNKQGYLVAILSNQGGVASGHATIGVADQALLKTIDLLQKQEAIVHYYDFAEAWDHNRKPNIGMAETLAAILRADYGRQLQISRENSFMVGDAAYTNEEWRAELQVWGNNVSNSDRLFAENYGIPFYEAVDFFAYAEAMAQLQPLPRPETRRGRLFAVITPEQLQKKIISLAGKFEERDQQTFTDVGEIKFLHLLSPRIRKDLAKVHFRGEKVSASEAFRVPNGVEPDKSLLGFHTLKNGLSYLGVNIASVSEVPIFFIIYWDGRALRAYIPLQGNPWNSRLHRPSILRDIRQRLAPRSFRK